MSGRDCRTRSSVDPKKSLMEVHSGTTVIAAISQRVPMRKGGPQNPVPSLT